MNRRESLKAIGLTSLSAGLLLDACKTQDKKETKAAGKENNDDRLESEVERDKALESETFFSKHEMATITLLADMIIPKDDRSGSASDAGVPDFIEFIVKDQPDHQLPMRGGLKWLDMQCLKRFSQGFSDCTAEQRISMVDEIAYPAKAKPDMQPGVAFFDRMRNLTASGFFSSKMGMKDIGYVGNQPNKWEGVPEDVIRQYGLMDVVFSKQQV